MNKIIFIADFFADQVNGGGELNNEEVIQLFLKREYNVTKLNSSLCSVDFIDNNKECFFIIANFAMLHNSCKYYLQSKCKYVIYEHDHKYLKSRNPATYENFIAPKDEIINYDFYKNALAVFVQSSFHENIIIKNLGLKNIVNLSGNLWNLESLSLLRQFSKKQKNNRASIMKSSIPHKNTNKSIEYCQNNNISFELIESMKYLDFLDRLTNNQKLVFFPLTPETLSRIVVEARMSNLSVITNKNVGATYEDWFKLKGEELIDFMLDKREKIISVVEGYIK